MKVMMSKSLETRINKESLEAHFNDEKNPTINLSVDVEDVKSIKRKNDRVCIKFSSSALDIERTEFLIDLSLSRNVEVISFQIRGNKKHSDKSFDLLVSSVSVRMCDGEDKPNRFSITGSLIK